MRMRMIMDGESDTDIFEEEDFPLSEREEEDEEWLEGDGGGCISPGKTQAAAASGQTRTEPAREPSEEGLRPSQAVPMSRIGLNDNKAGMEGLDKARINQIILDASKGSKYYQNELRKERQVRERVEGMLRALEMFSESQRAAAVRDADRELEQLEATRDLNHIIVHVDMDAFYASVEMRDDPALRDVPMAVGGNSMLSTSNYLARRYGVRAAMPGFIGKKLCPDLVVVPLHFAKYTEASELVREILRQYDPHFCPVGLDESYLDLTEFVRAKLKRQQQTHNSGGVGASESDSSGSVGDIGSSLLNPVHWRCAEEVVEGVRREIQERTRLTASAGLAPNMMLAKVASDMRKPDGQFTVGGTREAVREFVQTLPIRKVSGIGKVTESMLNALGVVTCGDLHSQRGLLQLLFSQTSSNHFLRVSLGLGSTRVHREYVRKSMSTQRTFAEISGASELQEKCLELCRELAGDMASDSITGRTVGLILKTVNFEVRTRAVTLPRSVSTAEELYSAATDLLTTETRACSPSPLRLRLMGVKISSLQRKGDSSESGRRRSKQETLDVFVQPPPTPTPAMQSPIKTDTQQSGAGEGGDGVMCPVCGRELGDTTSRAVNAHIDECLNIPIITSITTGTTGTSNGSTTTVQVKTESPTHHSSGVVSPHKLRGKRSQRSGVAGTRKRSVENEKSVTKRRKTLDQFWS